MKIQAHIKTLTGMVLLAVAVGTEAIAQAPKQESQFTNTSAPVASPVQRKIVVSLEDRKLALIEDGEVKKIYTVAVGKPSTPSPIGSFTIERRVANPTYSHNGQLVAPGPGNPVGTRWMGLSVHGYGIHGTNAPKSIGKAASHGCIRMSKADLEEFFEMVRAGDMVEIVGQRNEETAQLFVTPTSPAKTNSATQTADVIQPTPLTGTLTPSPSIEAAPTVQTAGLMSSRK
jgi:lipoprotein-anchoring transpeptidase ErfK/SrfK